VIEAGALAPDFTRAAPDADTVIAASISSSPACAICLRC